MVKDPLSRTIKKQSTNYSSTKFTQRKNGIIKN